MSQIYYRHICFPTTVKPVGIKALEGIPFPNQKYYGSNMFLLCLSPFTEIIFTVTFLIMMVTIDVKNNSGSFEWILEWDCQADLWPQRFFTYERLTNLNTFLPHTIMNEIISKEYYYLEYYKVTYKRTNNLKSTSAPVQRRISNTCHYSAAFKRSTSKLIFFRSHSKHKILGLKSCRFGSLPEVTF